MNIYVGNLSYDVGDEDLRELFLSCGEVTSAKVITDKMSGRSRGYGFVEMGTREGGERAVAELNGREIGGRRISVNEARPREEGGPRGGGGRPPGGGGRFGGGGGRDGGGRGGRPEGGRGGGGGRSPYRG